MHAWATCRCSSDLSSVLQHLLACVLLGVHVLILGVDILFAHPVSSCSRCVYYTGHANVQGIFNLLLFWGIWLFWLCSWPLLLIHHCCPPLTCVWCMQRTWETRWCPFFLTVLCEACRTLSHSMLCVCECGWGGERRAFIVLSKCSQMMACGKVETTHWKITDKINYFHAMLD